MVSTQRSPHAVVVPLPSLGHVNPLLHFSKLLAARGLFISFINTQWIEERIFRPPNDLKSVSRQLQERGLNIRLLSLSDGLPAEHPRYQKIDEYFQAMHKLGPAMLRLLEGASPPITCIVSDCLFACTYEVATALGVPRVLFWTMCSSAAIAFANSHLLLEKGYIPVNVEEAQRAENLITCLPGKIPPLRKKDLMTFFRIQDPGDVTFQIFLYESEIQNKADYVLVNVFEELQGPEAVAGLSKEGCPALAIGPVFLPHLLQDKASVFLPQLWEDETDCLQWLDTQGPSSVLYISFGSIAVMSISQLEELALGLEASRQPFLWVVRPDIATDGKAATLPEGFRERIKGRGMVIKWAPQLKVLSHPSVGGFLSHCGWNSTLESISMGVGRYGQSSSITPGL